MHSLQNEIVAKQIVQDRARAGMERHRVDVTYFERTSLLTRLKSWIANRQMTAGTGNAISINHPALARKTPAARA